MLGVSCPRQWLRVSVIHDKYHHGDADADGVKHDDVTYQRDFKYKDPEDSEKVEGGQNMFPAAPCQFFF